MVDSSPALAAAPDLAVTCAQVRGGNGRISVPLVLPGLRGALRSDPADGGGGGDVYYLSICGSGLLTRICLADLCGHGERVATLGREIHGLLQRYADRPDQRRLLRDLNGALLPIGMKAMTTAAVVTYYPPRRSFSFTYAGHPPGWYYCSRTDRWDRLEADAADDDASAPALVNGPLGIQESIAFTRTTRRAAVGDRIVLVTDGVLETPDASRTLFGDRRVSEALHDLRQSSNQLSAERTLITTLASG